MPGQDDHGEHSTPENAAPGAAPTTNTALASRFHQMFPVLTPAEIDRVRRYGEVRRFPAGELLFQTGEAVPGMYVILSGRVAIVPRDALGQVAPVAAFAEMIGAPLEEMTEIVPGEVMGEIGQLSGRPDLSVISARAVGDVEAIFILPASFRTLLVAEAELGERILRALILRRVAFIEIGFGGPVLIGPVHSPDVTRLSSFLERNGIPFRVVEPENQDASTVLAQVAPTPEELPLVVLPQGNVLKNPAKQDLARALGLVATSFRSEPYDVAIVGAGPAGLATAVYGASEGLSILVLERFAFGGQAGASARIENYLGFPTGVSGQALMARAFTQAQKFGVEFSLSTEVTRLDCVSERSRNDPVHILELADGRQVRARAVVVATGARYRRPEIPSLTQFEGHGVSYWASPAEARLCRDRNVALVGGGNSAGQAAVFLASHARHVHVLVRGPGLSSTMSRYLIDRIAASPNITVLCDTEVVGLFGTPDQGLNGVRWRNRRTGVEEQHPLAHLFLFIGADPAASWLTSCIPLDGKGFIPTGAEVRSTGRVPLALETGVEGIFAVGDVRCGSVKRVGAAIGEGAAVVAQLHTFLARRAATSPGEPAAVAPGAATPVG